jgi:hypothetical protein
MYPILADTNFGFHQPMFVIGNCGYQPDHERQTASVIYRKDRPCQTDQLS